MEKGMKAARYIILIISLAVNLNAIRAQYVIKPNNIWNNSYYINPAAINDDYQAAFSMTARKQWIGFPGAPSTYYATGTTYLSKINTQFGVKFFSDNIGYSSLTNVSLSYAYDISLNREWQLDMGLSPSYQSLSYDRNQVSTMSADDPTLYQNLLQEDNFNCDLGFELKNKYWRFGASSQNLLSLFLKENKVLNNANYLYLVYRKKEDQVVNLQYSVDAIQYGNIFQMEFCVTSYFRFYDESDLFNLGLFYRTKSEMGVLLGYKLSESLNLGYSYDFNVSGISQNTFGSHELVISYNFNKIQYKPYRY